MVLEIMFNDPIITVLIGLTLLVIAMSVIGTVLGVTLDIVGSLFGLVVGVLFLLAVLEIFGITLVDSSLLNPFIDLFAAFLSELWNLIIDKLLG